MYEETTERDKVHVRAEKFAALQEALADAWCAETSHEPDIWTSDNPAYKQCAVTSVLVQDHLGGEIDWARARIEDAGRLDEFYDDGDGVSHYFNRVDGERLDFTRGQFPMKTSYERDHETRAKKLEEFGSFRERILDNESDRKRYELLKDRFDKPSIL